MNTSDITVDITVKCKKTITLPYYKMGKCHAYMLYDKNECIQVCFGVERVGITMGHAGLVFLNEEDQECSESDFIEKYKDVSYTLSNKILIQE